MHDATLPQAIMHSRLQVHASRSYVYCPCMPGGVVMGESVGVCLHQSSAPHDAHFACWYASAHVHVYMHAIAVLVELIALQSFRRLHHRRFLARCACGRCP